MLLPIIIVVVMIIILVIPRGGGGDSSNSTGAYVYNYVAISVANNEGVYGTDHTIAMGMPVENPSLDYYNSVLTLLKNRNLVPNTVAALTQPDIDTPTEVVLFIEELFDIVRDARNVTFDLYRIEGRNVMDITELGATNTLTTAEKYSVINNLVVFETAELNTKFNGNNPDDSSLIIKNNQVHRIFETDYDSKNFRITLGYKK